MGGFQTPLTILQTAMTLGSMGARSDQADASANARIAALQRQQAIAERERAQRLQRTLATQHVNAAASGASSDGSAAAVAENLIAEGEAASADQQAATQNSIAGIQDSLAAVQQRNLLQESRTMLGAFGQVIKRRNLFDSLV